MNKQISEIVDKMCNAQFGLGYRKAIAEVEKIIDKIKYQGYDEDNNPFKELNADELKLKIKKLKEGEGKKC